MNPKPEIGKVGFEPSLYWLMRAKTAEEEAFWRRAVEQAPDNPLKEVATLRAQLQQAQQERDVARAQNAVLVEALQNAKRGHTYCEDSWYSCPLAPDGCADDSQVGCNCGADKRNTEIDKALSTTPNAAYEEWQAMRRVCEALTKCEQERLRRAQGKWVKPDDDMYLDATGALVEWGTKYHQGHPQGEDTNHE